MVRVHVIDVEIEILNVIEIDGYCECCMTPSIGQSTVICTDPFSD